MTKAQEETCNPDWIVNEKYGLVHKRDTLYTTCVVVITNDARRIEELRQYTLLNGLTAPLLEESSKGENNLVPNNKNIYEFNEWDGLKRIYPDRKPELIPLDMGMARDVDAMPSPICLMLRYMERELTEKPTTLIITGMTRPDENLNRAINQWAFNGTMLNNSSTVVVVVPCKKRQEGQNELEFLPKTTLDKCQVIDVIPSSRDERIAGIREVLATSGKELPDNEVERIADITSGLDLNQVDATLVDSILTHGGLNDKFIAGLKGDILTKGNEELKVKVMGQFGFERIGGYKALKNLFKRRVINVAKFSDYAKSIWAKRPKGILIFGMGGTGKTAFIEALQTEMALPFFQISPANFSSKWYGESEQKAEEFVKTIKANSPCLVYIDEFDAIGMARGGANDHEATRKVLSVLMQFMASDHDAIIVCTTNRVEDLDEAMIRRGRFNYVLPQLLPDYEARKEILKVHLNVVRHVSHNLTDADLDEIASMTNLWNGADIEGLIEETILLNLDMAIEQGYADKGDIIPIDKQQIMDAFSNAKIDLNHRQEVQEKYIKIAEKFVSDKTFMVELRAEATTENKPMSRMEQASARMKMKPKKE